MKGWPDKSHEPKEETDWVEYLKLGVLRNLFSPRFEDERPFDPTTLVTPSKREIQQEQNIQPISETYVQLFINNPLTQPSSDSSSATHSSNTDGYETDSSSSSHSSLKTQSDILDPEDIENVLESKHVCM